jgi:hypothetical protein
MRKSINIHRTTEERAKMTNYLKRIAVMEESGAKVAYDLH